MFSTLLIANRGEIACRVIRSAKRMGIKTVAVYSDADAGAPHVAMADAAVRIGAAPAKESYLRVDAILEAARATGAKAIHPGYGFLSENAEFAEACAKAGLVFVGPPPAAIRAMGLKDAAKALMIKAGVPVVPGYHGDEQGVSHLAKEAERIGYPVLIKAVAGGGGKGMRRVDKASDFTKALEGAQREAQAAFGDARVLVEKYVSAPRHVEIQVFADGHGNAVHLFERDCSLQRRHQKVIEEAPAPGMPADVRRAMGDAAVKCAKAIGYQGAGTVEFIVDGSKGLKADGFYFMEMNTRLQVEHPVTEMITGLDLVEWQLRVAAGEKLPRAQDQLAINGHAVEVRLYAEDPIKGFLPSIGRLERLKLPSTDAHVRVDSGVAEGGDVSMFYDPMIAKVVAWDQTRTGALSRLANALETAEVAGVKTNLAFLISSLRHDEFVAAKIDTGFIDRHKESLVGAATPAPADAVLFAALFVLLERRAKAAGSSPWRHLDGWRIGGVRQEEMLRLTEGEADRAVGVLYRDKGWRLSLDGKALDADAVFDKDGSISASLNGRRAQARVLRVSGNLVVLMLGRSYTFEPHDPLEAAEHTHDAGKELRAPMPGKVVQIMTKAGDHVRRGQALAIIEAMKMEHTLAAPGDLTVKDVPFRAGDQVGEGAVVVSFA
jgi:3-methylcrotonyl-CoA carboxylase alpha subunit